MNGLKRKIKVVWLCSFANQEIIERFAKSGVKEFAPWINNLINIFEGNNDIELHIISPNIFTDASIEFRKNNINYYLFKTSWCLPKILYNKFRINDLTNYIYIKNKVKKLLNNIKPDLIHLHGAENPIYSSAILPLSRSYQNLVTVQGFINLEKNVDNVFIRKRKEIEKKILENCQNFGVRTEDSCKLIRDFNAKALFFWHNYPMTRPEIIINNSNSVAEYDCVLFGRISPENGIEDLIKTISIVKKSKPDIKVILVGPIQMNKSYLENLFKSYGIENNVAIKGFFDTQQLAFQEVTKAKIDVLPTHYDVIPGSILECMYMGIPVIAYAVGGIPELNKERESLLLIEKGDVNGLAKKIIWLLNNIDERIKYSVNAKITAAPFFDNDKIYEDLITIYTKLTNHK